MKNSRVLKIKWFLFATITFLILFLSFYGRRLQGHITSVIDVSWIAGAVFFVLSLTLFFLLLRRKIYTIPLWSIFFSFIVLIFMAGAVLLKYLLPIEAVHLLIFSTLGWLAAAVLGPLRGIIAVMLISVGDEVFQFYLPDRVGDLQDVVVNLLSGAAGVILRSRCRKLF